MEKGLIGVGGRGERQVRRRGGLVRVGLRFGVGFGVGFGKR